MRCWNLKPEYINTQNKCAVCFGKPKQGEHSITVNGKHMPIELTMIKHHISYFPEKIAWVHWKCHQKIHDPDKPLTYLIQYTREESIEFYKQKRKKEKFTGVVI